MGSAWCIALWLAIHCSPPAPPSPAAAAATDRALTQVAATAAWLAAQSSPEPEDWGVVNSLQPEPLEAEIDRALQRQLGDFVEAWLREHGADAPAETLSDELLAELQRAGVVLASREGDGGDDREPKLASPFHGDVKLAVVRPADDPGLLAVSWEIELDFLGDASLYVFSTDGGRVERLLEWSAELAEWPDLGDRRQRAEPLPLGPTGVLNDFDFRLGPRDARGRFAVAVAWSEPSPHSSWGVASWAVLARGSHPRSPRVLARGSDSVFQCYDGDCYTLALEGDLVAVGYYGSGGELTVCNGFNASGMERRWRLAGGRAVELRAHSDDPFGFVSDWLEVPWKQAREWGVRGWRVRRWHRLLRQVRCELELAGRWVDGCEASPSRDMVELVLTDWSGRDDGEAEQTSFFFLIDGATDTLHLRGITTRLPAGDWQDGSDCFRDAGDAP